MKGHAFSRLSIQDLTFTRAAQTTTQGTVVAVQQGEGPGNLTLDIAEGFPSIDALLVMREGRLRKEQGLYLRLYRAAPRGPQLITNWNGYTNISKAPPNGQVHFTCGGDPDDWTCPNIVHLGGQRWSLQISKMRMEGELAEYEKAIGDQSIIVGVKVKHGGQTFELGSGDDIAFLRVRWVDHSRGVIASTRKYRSKPASCL